MRHACGCTEPLALHPTLQAAVGRGEVGEGQGEVGEAHGEVGEGQGWAATGSSGFLKSIKITAWKTGRIMLKEEKNATTHLSWKMSF